MAKNLISVFDMSAKDIWATIMLAKRLKAARTKKNTRLSGKTLGLIFEKPSTRTTVSFAVAMYQLGGFPLILNAENLQRKRGEPIRDTARVLSRYLDIMMVRAFHHEDIAEFARFSTVPVINGLTDLEHPCQVFGDLLTIVEKRKVRTLAQLKELKISFIGDGNNVANSWIAAAAQLGLNFTLARPKGYGPDAGMLDKARSAAISSGAVLNIIEDPVAAAHNADVLYTDVWTSMGEEAELEKRKVAFKNYQINGALLEQADRNCIVMHCLPAIQGEEISADVMEGPQSAIFDQAENRLHIQKAILLHLLGA